MPKQVYDIGGTKVRATDETSAKALATEINGGTLPAITSKNLVPTQSIVPEQPKPSTAPEGFTAQVGAQAENFLSGYNEMQSQNQRTLASFEKKIFDELTAPGEAFLTNQAYKDQGVDDAQTELRDINQKILESQRAQKAELEALGKQGALTPAQYNAQAQGINRKYISEQADLAVIQLSKQGKFSDAKAVADRAVTAMLEGQRNRLSALQFTYEKYSSLFDKNEARAFELAQSERQRVLDNDEYRLRAEFDAKIKQSDPLYQAQVANIYSEINKRNAENAAAPAKAQQRIDARVAKAATVLNKVTEAIGQMGVTTSGFLGGTTRYVPGAPAYNLNRTLDTIKANLGFDELQAMRDASPTGGALGQVAVQELAMLQATISSLDTGLDGQTLKSNLGQVEEHYVNWVAAAAPEKLPELGYQLTPTGEVVRITK